MDVNAPACDGPGYHDRRQISLQDGPASHDNDQQEGSPHCGSICDNHTRTTTTTTSSSSMSSSSPYHQRPAEAIHLQRRQPPRRYRNDYLEEPTYDDDDGISIPTVSSVSTRHFYEAELRQEHVYPTLQTLQDLPEDEPSSMLSLPPKPPTTGTSPQSLLPPNLAQQLVNHERTIFKSKPDLPKANQHLAGKPDDSLLKSPPTPIMTAKPNSHPTKDDPALSSKLELAQSLSVDVQPGACAVAGPAPNTTLQNSHLPSLSSEPPTQEEQQEQEQQPQEQEQPQPLRTFEIPVVEATLPEEEDTNGTSSFWKRRVLPLVLILLLLACGTTVGIVCGTGFCSSGDDDLLGDYQTILRTELGAPSDYFDTGSSSRVPNQALEWLAQDSKDYSPTTSQARLAQRYVLAVLYFSTTKKEDWRHCGLTGGTAEDDSCEMPIDATLDLENPLPPASSWLQNTHECTWAGILCGEMEQVQEVALRKFVV